MKTLPDSITTPDHLDDLISEPGSEVIDAISRIDGDFIFLGVGGKIGPSLARMAKKACDRAGVNKRIIGVFRSGSKEQLKQIEDAGIEPVTGDLLDISFIKNLPAVKNVFFLAGMKFGSQGNLSQTWAVNSFMPGLVAEHFKDSKIVAYSTGCVYPLVSVESGGSLETDTPEPFGEYAQSCLGRERMFEYGSVKYNTPVTLIRLNYSVELRYGVLVDIALKVKNKQPVDLSMGYFNAIWQGDANEMVLRSIETTASPAVILNITGPEILSVREVANDFGRLFNVDVKFTGKESDTALLSNSNVAFNMLGTPRTPIKQVIKWTAGWIMNEGKLLHKPTRFEVRDGKY